MNFLFYFIFLSWFLIECIGWHSFTKSYVSSVITQQTSSAHGIPCPLPQVKSLCIPIVSSFALPTHLHLPNPLALCLSPHFGLCLKVYVCAYTYFSCLIPNFKSQNIVFFSQSRLQYESLPILKFVFYFQLPLNTLK